METALTGWTRSTFEAAGLEREVWTKGSGPAVIVVHEVPGITPKVLAFAEEVVASGFTVAMPSLVGTPGREMSNKYAVRSLLKVCVAREFVSLATNRTSPVIAWFGPSPVTFTAAPAARALVRSACASAAGSRWE